MKLVAQFPKTAAVLVTLLMALPASPQAFAQAVPDVPTLPGLPLPGPNSHCVQSDLTQTALLEDLNRALGGHVYFASDHGAPVICGTDGQPVSAYALLMSQGKGIIDNYTATAALIQHQADDRDHATVPGGDVVYPTFPLLQDDFTGHRVGGVGDWNVVTQGGEPAGFTLANTTDINGTRTEYRFGTDGGYARGIHQWLVSPMMDLDAARGNAAALHSLLAAESVAIYDLETMCYINPSAPRTPAAGPVGSITPVVLPSGSLISAICGQYAISTNDFPGAAPLSSPYDKPGKLLVDTMVQQVKAITASLPLVRAAATLDFDYRFNLANDTDGVRLWLYVGQQAPDRATLFNPTALTANSNAQTGLDEAPIDEANAASGASVAACSSANGNFNTINCRASGTGGILLGQDGLPFCTLPGMDVTQAFKDPSSAQGANGEVCAFTGDHVGRLHLDLTNETGQRVWLMLEVMTMPPSGRASDEGYFQDTGKFPRQDGFGFELERVNATAQAWPRNFRVENVGLNLPYTPPGNPSHDEGTVHTVAPGLAAAPVAVDILNAGSEVENGTLSVSLAVRNDTDGSYAPMGSTLVNADGGQVLNVTPGEVRRVWFTWGAIAPTDGVRYQLTATLTADDITQHVNETEQLNRTTVAEPATTPVRLPNHASDPTGQDDHTSAAIDVRAYVRHALSTVRARSGDSGPAMEICAAIQNLVCDPSNAAQKGVTRILQVGIRNDGSQPEAITGTLLFTLNGVDKSASILDGVSRNVGLVQPGETRVVTWTVVPADPGAFTATAVFQTSAGSATATATRQVYVQRTSGMLCFDDGATDRECSPGFVLSQPPVLAGQNVTASLATPAGLLVATTVDATNGALYLRDPTGVWNQTPLANLSNLSLTHAGLSMPSGNTGFASIRAMVQGPDGIYLVGDNGTVLRDAQGVIASIPFNASTQPFNLNAAAWWNGTLWVGGAANNLMWWNQSAMNLQPALNITYQRPASGGGAVNATFLGSVHALLVQRNSLWAAADNGALLLNTSGAWVLASLDNATPTANFLDLGLDVNNLVYVTGSQGTFAREISPGAANFSSYLAPPTPVVGIHPDLVSLDFAPTGAIYVRDAWGDVYFCSSCGSAPSPGWAPASLALPLLPSTGALAQVVGTASSPTAMTILATGGALLDFTNGTSVAANLGDWSALSPLYAPNGAVETVPVLPASSPDQSFRILLPKSVTGYSKFRISIEHNVLDVQAGPGSAKAGVPPAAFLRIVYNSQYPSGTVLTNYQTCPPPDAALAQVNHGQVPTAPAVQATGTLPGLGDVCHVNGTLVQVGGIFLQDVVNWTQPTAGAGWDHFTTIVPAGVYEAAAGSQTGTFAGIELFQHGQIRWSVDQVDVQGYNAKGWTSIFHYGGPGDVSASYTRSVAVPIADAQEAARAVLGSAALAGCSSADQASNGNVTAITGTCDLANFSCNYLGAVAIKPVVACFDYPDTYDPNTWNWREVRTPYYGNATSPWHLTSLGGRPVWAANDELKGGGSSPHLQSGYNSRLVTPILDLSGADDPVVSFRQSYAFRMDIGTAPNVNPADVGWLEVQYLRQGPTECPPPATSDTTCGWTPFYNVSPVGGYPNGSAMGLGAFTNTMTSQTFWPDTNSTWNLLSGTAKAYMPSFPLVGPDPTNAAFNTSYSYWGRIAPVGVDGKITATLNPDTYQSVQVSLKDAACRAGFNDLDCIPLNYANQTVNLAGHKVRLGFHLETNFVRGLGMAQTYGVDGNPKSDPTFNVGGAPPTATPKSFAGEGWYITDLRVEGSRNLGIDLAATNLTFREGYDATKIGVGPGTRVALNVTVTNNGIFDALGYTGALEIRRVIDPVQKISQVIQTIPLAQQPQLASGASMNHTFLWDVPGGAANEGARYALTFTVTPVGIDRDENPTDNVIRLGTLTNPILALSQPGFHLDTQVRPQNATSQIPRAIVQYIVNTGNVPLTSFTLTRDILDANGPVGRSLAATLSAGSTTLSGDPNTFHDADVGLAVSGPGIPAGAILAGLVSDRIATLSLPATGSAHGATLNLAAHRVFTTLRPIAEGTRVSLASVADLDPSTDIFFQPPSATDYSLVVRATVPTLAAGTLTDSTSTRIRSLDAFLFDDAESGVQGESFRGNWSFDPNWSVQSPGFRSASAYGFGDPASNTYPNNADVSATLPTVDIGSARDAKVAFYTRYQFEPGFDAGALQASADGGKTWVDLPAANDPLNNLPKGFISDTPLAPSNPLHPDGNPDTVTYAFSGDSATLPAASNGWVYSQFDLTQFPNVTQRNTSYEAFRNRELASYQKGNGNNSYLSAPLANNATYTDQSWALDSNQPAQRYWEIDNLTQDAGSAANAALSSSAVVSPIGDGALWWSGSASVRDDNVFPIRNQMLNIPVNLSTLTPDGRTRVSVDWWEWANRFDQIFRASDGSGAFLNAYGSAPYNGNPTPTYRYNVSKPVLVEQRGSWYHMSSDISSMMGQPQFNISFVYAPIVPDSLNKSAGAGNCDGFADKPAPANLLNIRQYCMGQGQGAFYNQDDRGFAIDGFHITTSQVLNGQATNVRTLLGTSAAWSSASLVACPLVNETLWIQGNQGFPCYAQTDSTKAPVFDGYRRLPLQTNTTWSLVSSIPGVPSAWKTVRVTDPNGAGTDANLLTPQGDVPYAWYTGYPNLTNSQASSWCSGSALSWGAGKLDVGGPGCVNPEPNPVPGSESRLVTPTLDLSHIAGTNALLSFWHRYAFAVIPIARDDHALASGGVVEMQVYNDATGTWGPWTQIYARPDAMTPFPATGVVAPDSAYNGEGTATSAPARGGYSMFVVNATTTKAGGLAREDPPFQPQPAPAGSGIQGDVQYLYSGNSMTMDPTHNGWVQAHYDVSSFIGKKVRFGFHVFFTPSPSVFQQNANLDSRVNATPDIMRGGWWIGNVSLVGDVITGGPIQLRLRAATDGAVNAGHWQVDDVSVFGQRYGSNVAIFADETTLHKTLPGQTVTIPITIRNLGDTVRRGLAVEAHLPPGPLVGQVNLSGSGPAGNATESNTPDLSPTNGGILLLANPLAPGQSTTVYLRATFGPDVSPSNSTVLLELRQQAVDTGLYYPIRDNEVKGLLQRAPTIAVTAKAQLATSVTTDSAMGTVGQPVQVTVRVSDNAGVPVTATLQCSAAINDYTKPANTADPTYIPQNVTRMNVPTCGSQAISLLDGGSVTTTFSVTPTAAGIMHFHVVGHGNDGTDGGFDLTPIDFALAVAAPAQPFVDTFDNPQDIANNWTAMGSGVKPVWSYTRGHNATGALLLGISDNASNAGESDQFYPQHFEAISPMIDLHNFTTTQGAFLTFWHQDRLGAGEGGDVGAIVYDDETSAQGTSTAASCKLYPLTGYEGHLTEFVPPPTPTGGQGVPPDSNAAWGTEVPSTSSPGLWPTRDEYFVTNGTWEEGWSKAVFDLSNQPQCWPAGYPVGGPPSPGMTNLTLVGHKIQLVFRVWPGQSQNHLQTKRGRGQGMLIDDLSVGPYALGIHPVSGQSAILLDNTTKTFNVVVQNQGTFTDAVQVVYNPDRSSAPAGSVQPDPTVVTLQPGASRIIPVTITLPRDPSLLPTSYRVTLDVRSVLDVAAGASTTLDLAFNPRQLADLGVAMALPSGAAASVQEGTDAFIPITLDNHGLVDSPATRLHVVDTWVEGGTTTAYDFGVPPIHSSLTSPDASTALIEFNWKPARGTVGTHVLSATVDPDGLIDEYSRSDDQATLSVPVSPLLVPDMNISDASLMRVRNAVSALVDPSQDADVTHYEVTAGELVTFELKVLNTGRAAATTVDVRASIGSLTLPAKTIPFIPAGGQAIVTFNWLAQKGEYNLSFDVRNEQLQLSTDNDHYPGSGLVLLRVKDYDVHVDLAPLPALLDPGSDLKVPFNVSNAGNAGEDVAFVTQAPDGVAVTLSSPGLFIPAGGRYTGVAHVHVGDAAVAGAQEAQFIRVLAVSRENPMKVASAQAPLAVRAEYAGALVATVASGSPPLVTIPITARNEGNSLEPWTVRVNLPAGWAAQETLPAKLVVPPRGEATLLLHVAVPPGTAPGPQAVTVAAVMPDGEVRQGAVSVGVLPSRVASASLVDANARPAEGALAYAVWVTNNGNTATPFQVLLTQLPAGVQATLEPSTFSLAPGAKTVATLLVTPNASVQAGTYPITAYALFPGVTPDTNEGRANVQSLAVSILRPDLQVTTLEYAPHQGLRAGDRVNVRVPVANIGTGAALDVPVQLFVDDVFVGESRVTSLAAGAQTEVSFNWTSLPGTHTLTAVADPYNDTVDPDRTNNAVSTQATVGGPDLTGGLAAQRAKVPAPGMGLSLIALAAISLALAKRGPRRPPK